MRLLGRLILGVGSLLIGMLAERVDAATCFNNDESLQNLPTVIGKKDQSGKRPFALACDTVFVRKGKTTTIYPGTMLYFAIPSLTRVIKVEGTLIMKGTKNDYVIISGSLDSTRNGYEAGNQPWGGIEITQSGKLDMEFAGMMRAPTPITAFSPRVKIVNSWFMGGSSIFLPDGRSLPLEATWHAINELDLSKSNSDLKTVDIVPPKDGLSQKEKNELLAKGQGFWTWKKAVLGAGVLAVVGVGASVLMTPEESVSPDKAKAPEKKVTIDPFDGGLPVID